MKKYYLILAHNNPVQLLQLVEALQDDLSFFYIHVDLKSDIRDFAILNGQANVFFVDKRVSVLWANISQTYAALECIKLALETQKDDGFFILLSAADYPLQSNEFINDFLAIHKDANFINISPVNKAWSEKEVIRRLQKYTFFLSDTRGDFVSISPIFSLHFFKKILRNGWRIVKLLRSRKRFEFIKLFARRKPIITAYGGAQWWMINSQTMKLVIDWLSAHSELMKYHQHTLFSEEFIFQSVIVHLQEKHNILVKPCVTYANWKRKGVILPVTFTSCDIEELKEAAQQNMLFARKFDIKIDADIFPLLNDMYKQSS